MAFSFEPVKFIRSSNELSNRNSSDNVLIETGDHEIPKISDSHSKNIDAHSFYLSIIGNCSSCFSSSAECSCASGSKNSDSQKIISQKRQKIDRPSKKSIPSDILKNRFLRAATEGDLSTIDEYLRENLSILNCVDDFGWSALMCSAYENRYHVVEFLLNRGADFTLKNQKNRTALSLARRRGHRKIVALLSKAENGQGPLGPAGILSGSLVGSPRGVTTHSATLPMANYEKSQIDNREFFCEICSSNFRDPNHETSTVHVLNLASTEEDNAAPSYLLPHTNKGFQLMLKEGWDARRGLGLKSQGRWYPVKTILKRDRRGLGSKKEAKPRVTHFGANDVKAIEKGNQDSRKVKLKSELANKKEREKIQNKEREWIKNFRREFY